MEAGGGGGCLHRAPDADGPKKNKSEYTAHRWEPRSQQKLEERQNAKPNAPAGNMPGAPAAQITAVFKTKWGVFAYAPKKSSEWLHGRGYHSGWNLASPPTCDVY